MFEQRCDICLELRNILTKINEPCQKGILPWSYWLHYIIPEVEWLEDYLICDYCSADLVNACNFKERCLKVRNSVCKLEEFSDSNINYTDNNSDTDSINETFICYHCKEEFSKKTNLIDHIEQKHSIINSDYKYKRKQECLNCGRKFSLSASLREHTLVCDGVSRHRKIKAEYQCDKCEKFYSTKKILLAHKRKCQTKVLRTTEYQCTKCNNYYISQKTLKEHEKRGCKKDGFIEEIICKICNETFKSSLLLKKHISDYHKSDCYCNICGIKFENNSEYEAHKNFQHEDVQCKKVKKFTCEICGEAFSLLKSIIEHCGTVHSLEEKSIKPYCCDICNNRFRSSTNLVTHKLYHERNRTNICSSCGKSFITKNDLAAHEYIHYNHRKYRCDKCEKAFKTHTNLRTHRLIVHTDPLLWKYICQVCNKRFPQKSNHDQHLRRHIGEKNFVCPLCKKSFASKSEMQEHIGCHSNERAFKCNHCGKEYRKRHTYNVHLTKVHGIGNAKVRIRERKYACHICPGRFHDRLKLARHLCTHSGLKPFACDECDKRFTDKSYLKHHLKTYHNIIPAENITDYSL